MSDLYVVRWQERDHGTRSFESMRMLSSHLTMCAYVEDLYKRNRDPQIRIEEYHRIDEYEYRGTWDE